MSTKICRTAYVDLKVKMHGFTRTKDRGIPQFVIQQEETSKEKMIQTIGTVKAGVIEGDDDCPRLICFSVYDTKPVHFLSMATEELKWLTKERDVYDSENHTKVSMEFHCTIVQEEYNYGMNKIDLGDQVQNYY